MDSGILTFSEENIGDLRDEIAPLFQEHWKVISDAYPASELRVNWDFYTELGNSLRLFTARFDGVLIGYAMVFLLKHPHRSLDVVATVDAFYVVPEYRFGGTANKLLNFAEESLKKIGASFLDFAVRDAVHKRWLGFLGYKQTEVLMERAL